MPKLSFGDWVGGDRDGHPFVTTRVTADTLGLLRRHAIELIAEHLTRLAARLSLFERLQVPDNELRERITVLAERLGARGRAGIQRNRDEPWATVHQSDAGFAADSELGGRGGAQRREFPLPAGR